jgi:carbonic anhydrase/acetyltransferase-like protein (isoleucine patch superfamily)
MAIFRLGDIAPEFDSNEWWVAPTATVIGRVRLGRAASVWFGAVLRGDNEPIVVGEESNVQDGAILHTDPGASLEIGPRVTVGHRAMLHGCTVGEGSLVGIGAILLNHVEVGAGCLIGAHTLIPENKKIPPRSLVMGTPGKVVRTLTDDEVGRLVLSAEHYVENWRRYARELGPVTAGG